jgi:hypothetical protein
MGQRLLGAYLALATGCAGDPPPPPTASAPPPRVPEVVVQRALEATPSGEAVRWRITESGQQGTVTPVRTFRTAAGFCREYAVTLSLPDGTGHAWRDVACRDPAGSWRPPSADA